MQNLAHIDEIKFTGYNDQYAPHLLPPGMFSVLTNVNIENNSLNKRKGSTKVANTLGAYSILGLSAFEPAAGTKYIISVLDGASNSQAYSWTGSGAFSTLGSANLATASQFNFVQASNSLFGWNGTNVIDINSSLSLTKDRAGMPLGKFGAWFHNYLFVAGVSGSPNRLYWSNLGVPTTFTGSDYVDINANDGDEITGMAQFNDELYIFKRNTVWSITGWSGATFGATTIAGQNTNSRISGFGTPSHQSIVNTGKDLYYLSFVGGVPHFRSLTQTVFAKTIDDGVISLDIEATMNGLNKLQLSKVAGIYDGKAVRWALPNSSSTTNNIVLVFNPALTMESPLGIHRSWVKHTGKTPSQYTISTISGRSKIYWGDASTGGKVIEDDTSVYTDDGTTVEMDVQSRDYLIDIAKKGKFKYVYLRHGIGSSGTLQVKARIDQSADFSTQESISLAGNSPGLGPTGTFTLGTSVLGGSSINTHRTTLLQVVGHALGLEFKEATAVACTVYDYSIFGYKKGLRAS